MLELCGFINCGTLLLQTLYIYNNDYTIVSYCWRNLQEENRYGWPECCHKLDNLQLLCDHVGTDLAVDENFLKSQIKFFI